MTDWTAGYVADIGYTYGYYTELNPLRIKLAFLNAGLVPPEVGTACELGFGQGVSANIHASASIVQWQGTDFNPAQAAFAQELAQAGGNDAQLFDQSFEEFCTRPDLPDFDFISLHGIWSWVSDANRQVIADFLRRKLKVGGVVYLSYNTQPGWAGMIPLRNLMTQHARVMGTEASGIVSRIDNALAFGQKLLTVAPAYAEAHPQAAKRFEGLQGHNRNYLAHEYFNRDWQPMAFDELARWFEDTKLQWACSADYVDAIDSLKLSEAQRQFLGEIEDPMFRESVRDFCLNRQFRKDYWVRGARKLSDFARTEALRQLRFVLAKPRQEINMFEPLVNVMASHKVFTLQALEKALGPDTEGGQKMGLQEIVQALLILCSNGDVQAAQSDADIARARPSVDKLNAHLLQLSRGSQDVNFLASPVTGGGITVQTFHLWFLLARLQGAKKPMEWAEFVFDLLLAKGLGVVKDGQVVGTRKEGVQELKLKADAFNKKELPVLIALGIA